MVASALLSSNTALWSTPQPFFDLLHAEFKFDLDVCALPENAKCERFFSPEQDCFKQSWARASAFMNPVYGNAEHVCKRNCTKKKCKKRGYHCTVYQPGINDFMRKAYNEVFNPGHPCAADRVVSLVPARVDTRWWWDYATKGEVRFVKGRLKFGGTAAFAAPFPSAVVIFERLRKPSAIWWEKSNEYSLPLFP